MSLADGLAIAKWLTQRVDKVSKFFKKKGRENVVKKIDNAVDSGDATAIGSIVQSIKKDREARASQ